MRSKRLQCRSACVPSELPGYSPMDLLPALLMGFTWHLHSTLYPISISVMVVERSTASTDQVPAAGGHAFPGIPKNLQPTTRM
jgi:hypothetical protein